MRTAWCMSAPWCELTASWRVACAQAGSLLNSDMSTAGTATTMTAIAVASAMRIRTAPPFVGRALGARLALLGVGRAPAFAFAPRTASGKASSVLACRRRVCGRLCTALLELLLGVVLDSGPGTPGLIDGSISEPADVAGGPGLPAALGVQLECGRVLHRGGVVSAGPASRSHPSTSRPRTGRRRRHPRRSCHPTRAGGCRPSRPCRCSLHPTRRRRPVPRPVPELAPGPAPGSSRCRAWARAAAAAAAA